MFKTVLGRLVEITQCEQGWIGHERGHDVVSEHGADEKEASLKAILLVLAPWQYAKTLCVLHNYESNDIRTLSQAPWSNTPWPGRILMCGDKRPDAKMSIVSAVRRCVEFHVSWPNTATLIDHSSTQHKSHSFTMARSGITKGSNKGHVTEQINRPKREAASKAVSNLTLEGNWNNDWRAASSTNVQ